jgi:ABC-2 type transport system permease protein
MSSPIADLTYRGYGGPMTGTDRRWWAIAKMTMRLGIKRKGFWVWASFSCWGYLLMMAIFYFADLAASGAPQAANPIMKSIVWRDQVVVGYSQAQLWLFILAVLTGIGQIANDNRANALLIYLSKPCTKLDYLVGKWLGIFVPLYCVALAPCLVFWAYIAMSFREYGSVSSAPYLPFQLIVMCAAPAFLLSSLCVGISSLFKDGRLAGATFFGLYFIPYFFTVLVGTVNAFSDKQVGIVRDLFYASIDGANIGMGKLICNTDGSPMLGQRGPQAHIIGRPDAWLELAAFFGVSLFCFLIAWLRIRPVEVVN